MHLYVKKQALRGRTPGSETEKVWKENSTEKRLSHSLTSLPLGWSVPLVESPPLPFSHQANPSHPSELS